MSVMSVMSAVFQQDNARCLQELYFHSRKKRKDAYNLLFAIDLIQKRNGTRSALPHSTAKEPPVFIIRSVLVPHIGRHFRAFDAIVGFVGLVMHAGSMGVAVSWLGMAVPFGMLV